MPALCATLTPDNSLPCSAATDDASSKRLSWGKIMQKLTDFSNHSLHSDDEHFRNAFSHSGSDSVDSGSLSESDFLYDPVEETLCSEVVDLIEQSLTEAKDSALRCSKLLIPDQLMEHIGQELLHLAASEPCGLRGALINLCVEQSNACQSVEQIAVDPDLVPTFQLTLVLRLESGGLWPMIQDLFAPRSPSAPILRHALRLNTGFRVIKKKLYSSEELVIEEC
ncbi:DNA damage-inducible transcript 4 protein [Acipenser ruthenus]|uniref:DNA damage-inducible transcript 4 protein n=1 Tax=Acipenser ruthenus TaxID=7906 RepID=A0A444UF31_ACIRT|nr:DNA damage-inducible transcript 4 protein [Acipenser ruthenus]